MDLEGRFLDVMGKGMRFDCAVRCAKVCIVWLINWA